MTKKEIDQLAETIVNILLEKQKVMDDAFKKDVENMLDGQEDVSFGVITKDDVLKDQLERLEHSLEVALAQEDFKECAKLKQKIEEFKTKYDM